MNLPKVLYNREFLKLWIAQIASQFGLNILNFVLLLKVYEATSLNTPVSLLLLTFGIPGLLLGYLAGSYVDNLDNRAVLIVTNIVRAITVLLLFFFPDHLSVYYLIALVIAVASQFFIPAEGSILPRVVKEDQLLEANSIFTSTLYVMTIFGFMLAGPALNLFNTSGTALLIALSFLIALIAVWLLPRERSEVHPLASVQLVVRLLQGLKFVWKAVEVRNALFFLTLTQTIFLVIASIAPGYVNQNLHTDVKDASVILVAPAAVGLLLGAVFINKLSKKFSQRRIVNMGLLGMGLTLTLLTLVGAVFPGRAGVWSTIILACLLGVEIAFINIPAATAMQTDTTDELRGRMYGLLVSLQSGASLLPVILAGALADLFGVAFVLQMIGVVVLLVGFFRLRRRFI